VTNIGVSKLEIALDQDHRRPLGPLGLDSAVVIGLTDWVRGERRRLREAVECPMLAAEVGGGEKRGGRQAEDQGFSGAGCASHGGRL